MGICRYMAIQIFDSSASPPCPTPMQWRCPKDCWRPLRPRASKRPGHETGCSQRRLNNINTVTKANHFKGHGLMRLKQCHKPSIWEWFVQTTHKYIWWWLGGWFLALFYHLVMTTSSPWKITMLLRTVNHLFLWAIYTMVYKWWFS